MQTASGKKSTQSLTLQAATPELEELFQVVRFQEELSDETQWYAFPHLLT